LEDEFPVHAVSVQSFKIMAAEVTKTEWESVYGELPVCVKPNGDWYEQEGEPNSPVVCVEWEAAKGFCEAIGGRLPTEAEWEYAARGGTTTRAYCGDDPECVRDIAWGPWDAGFGQNPWPLPSGGKQANQYGLYDMLGNASEWTEDFYGLYSEEYQENPEGPDAGEWHVRRGGSTWEGVEGSVLSGVTLSASSRFTKTLINSPLANFVQGVRCVKDYVWPTVELK
jgi:formylglycine-generating enzyme required for sulfatase activity